jgi:nitrogen regulatory protein P-II 1
MRTAKVQSGTRLLVNRRIWGAIAGSAREDSVAVVQIVALVKPFRAEAVLAALEPIDVVAGTVREAMGFGRQKNRLHRYLGSEYSDSFLPKVEITIFVDDRDAADALRTIVTHARTGRIGDGKVLVVRCHGEAVGWGTGT